MRAAGTTEWVNHVLNKIFVNNTTPDSCSCLMVWQVAVYIYCLFACGVRGHPGYRFWVTTNNITL